MPLMGTSEVRRKQQAVRPDLDVASDALRSVLPSVGVGDVEAVDRHDTLPGRGHLEQQLLSREVAKRQGGAIGRCERGAELVNVGLAAAADGAPGSGVDCADEVGELRLGCVCDRVPLHRVDAHRPLGVLVGVCHPDEDRLVDLLVACPHTPAAGFGERGRMAPHGYENAQGDKR